MWRTIPILLTAVVVAPLACRRVPDSSAVTLSTDWEEIAPAVPASGDSPWWRGPAGDGKFGHQDVPLSWSETENVVWRAAVPGRGHSTPIVCGDRVIAYTADEDREEHIVLCYARDTGSELWRTVTHVGSLMYRHTKNSHASATPAFDGERLFVVAIQDGGVRVSALDLAGDIRWQTKAGDFKSRHGYGSSPVLWRSFVIVNGDNHRGGFVAALHRATGEIVWRAPRPDEASFGTPIVGDVAGRSQLLLSGAGIVASYDPRTGERLWYCAGPSRVTAATMAFGGDLVFASGGYPDKEILCIRANGSGDVTGSHVVWRTRRGVAYVPSPLLHDDRLYVVADNGIVTCFRAADGEVVWKDRLRGEFSASPVLIDGRIFVVDESGTTHVFAAGDAFELLAANRLGDAGFASLVVGGGRIFLRTGTALYCIGKR